MGGENKLINTGHNTQEVDFKHWSVGKVQFVQILVTTSAAYIVKYTL